MPAIMTAHMNILESSAVALAEGGASPETPLSRLWDRNVGRPFIASSGGTLSVGIDQGASPKAVDRLIIPAGHNLAGSMLSLACSDDGVQYTEALAPWEAAEGLVNVSWSPLAKRYWRFTVSGAAEPPRLAELFITSTYTWERNPQRPTGSMSPEFNVKKLRSSGGQERSLVMGPPLRRRSYGSVRFGSAMRSEMQGLEATWQGCVPFWLSDHDEEWIFGTLETGLAMAEVSEGLWKMRFEFLEVAP